ncbi:MAG: hypothetical protein IKZ82_11710 [Clostridia bacterium]|nr:hypothetical protein [Clostridia bacterium]
MLTRCLGCMEQYDSEYKVCPRCGYTVSKEAREAIHLPVGVVLYNRYIVGRVLGYGGFGATYIAWG